MDYIGISALLASITGGGLLTFALKNMNDKLSEKQDKSVCILSHLQIEKDFNRGQKNFDDMVRSIESLKDQLAKNNEGLSLLTQAFNSFLERSRQRSTDHHGS